MSTSYTGRDIVAIRQNLIDKINTLTGDFTDRNQSDLGMVFLEFVASVGDFLSFYMDKQALETYLDTAVQDKNIRGLLRTMNYKLPLLGGAKGSVMVTFEKAVDATYLIPRYTEFYCSEDKVFYCTTQEYRLYSGDTSIELNVLQGEYNSLVTTKADIISSGTGRRIYLNSTTVAEGSVEINQDGVVWEEVDDAILKYQGGYYYSLHKDSNNFVYILLSPNYLDLL